MKNTPSPPSPPPSSPEPPAPLTPAQQRARRAEQRAFIQEQQATRRLPLPERTRSSRQPAGKLFDAAGLRRMPVQVTPAAQALMDASSSQGRLLPQALSEILGAHEDEFGRLATIVVDVTPKSTHFAIAAEDLDPETGQEPLLLVIQLLHESGQEEHHHRFLINAAHLSDLHPLTHAPLFSAEVCAKEFLRLYHFQRQMLRQALQQMEQMEQAGGGTGGAASLSEPERSLAVASAEQPILDTSRPRRRSSARPGRRSRVPAEQAEQAEQAEKAEKE